MYFSLKVINLVALSLYQSASRLDNSFSVFQPYAAMKSFPDRCDRTPIFALDVF